MALATQCPHCHTTFRVASDQLKLRGGIVRCGSCQRIFDGSAHLIDVEALAAAKQAAASDAAAPAIDASPADDATATATALATPEPAASEPAPADDGNDQPVYTLDFDHTFDPFGILPKVEPTLDTAAPAEAEPPAEAAVDADAAAHEAGTAVDDLPPAPEPEPEPAPEPAPAQAYAPAGRIEPHFDLPVDEALVAQPLPGHEAEPEPEPEPEPDAGPAAESAADTEPPAGAADAAPPSRPAPWARSLDTDIPSAALPLRASVDGDAHPYRGDMPQPAPRSARAKAVEARTRRSKMTPTRIEPPKLRVPAEPDEPEFVKRSRRQEQSGRTVRVLMAAGVVVLLLVLAAQLLLNFRNELAVRYPGARPVLASACGLVGCHVGLPAQADNLVIDDGELSTLGPDTYSLNTQLRNQGGIALAWPSIELELTDANNRPVLRRVFGPADYLPAGTPIAAGFGAHTEQPVRLNFALAELKPSGYHTFVFYP